MATLIVVYGFKIIFMYRILYIYIYIVKGLCALLKKHTKKLPLLLLYMYLVSVKFNGDNKTVTKLR